MFVKFNDNDDVYYVELKYLKLDCYEANKINVVVNGHYIHTFDLTNPIEREMSEKFEIALDRILTKKYNIVFDLTNYFRVLKRLTEEDEFEEYDEEEDD